MGMDVCGKGNPDAYFRANCWSWRPIHALCETVIYENDLNLNTEYWGSNDGRGLETQEDCNKLANALEAHLKNTELTEENDKIFLCLGSWSTADGRFLHEEEELNETYPIGTVLSGAVVMKDGTIAYSTHSTSLDHIKEFISFLRTCEGFEIW
jgi:hypothetical protein